MYHFCAHELCCAGRGEGSSVVLVGEKERVVVLCEPKRRRCANTHRKQERSACSTGTKASCGFEHGRLIAVAPVSCFLSASKKMRPSNRFSEDAKYQELPNSAH